MSGIVNTVSKAASSVVQDTTKVLNAPVDFVMRNGPGFIKNDKMLQDINSLTKDSLNSPAAALDSMRSGSTLTQGLMAGGAAPMSDAKSITGDVMSTFSPQQQTPTIAVQDPAAVAAANANAKAAAARQAQIDQMTGAPGRNGTILTDRYTYNT